MLRSLLLCSVLLTPVFACTGGSCTPARAENLNPARVSLIAATQSERGATKPAPPVPAAPAKKSAPKERDQRPTPPAHLFM
jgi:hypothetical protein